MKEKKSVLIIDDDHLMRRAWTRYFKAHEWDWEIETVATVNDAIMVICAKEYDLIISDFDLKDREGDGVTVLQMAWIEQPKARRIMCSGSDPGEIRIKGALDLVIVDCFISKPFATATVDAMLKKEFTKTEETG